MNNAEPIANDHDIAQILKPAKRVRIKVDYENNAETWWNVATFAPNLANCPDACKSIVNQTCSPDAVTVSAEDATAFRAWAEKLPGWADGPEYAKYPFTFTEVE